MELTVIQLLGVGLIVWAPLTVVVLYVVWRRRGRMDEELRWECVSCGCRDCGCDERR